MVKLNQQQIEAIKTCGHPLLVLAGAGSGKTTVITHKIAHLVDTMGIAPQHIYAVTFTNKAAREMKERVNKRLKGKSDARVNVSTFHTLGLNIIRSERKALELKSGFSIFDAYDAHSLVKELLPGDDDSKERATNAQQQISRWKNALIVPDEALATATNDALQHAAKIYQQYQRHLKAYNAIDFDDLILLPTLLFQQHPNILDHWQNKVRYLLVDEYQDTNASQYSLVKQLIGVRQAFTVVGDDDQSIYAWRGAVPENLANLQRDFPKLQVIKLEQNYRSMGRILKAANEVIAKNTHLFEKKLWSKMGYGDPIRVLQCENDDAEAERIATEIISQRLKQRTQFKDYAVLYRGNHQARLLEMKLQQFQIPYKISGGSSFFDKAEIKDILAYLRVIVNPDDDTAFLRVINVPRRQIGPATLEALGQYATQRHISLYTACDELGLQQYLKPAQLEKLQRFRHWIQSLSKRCFELGPQQALNEMLDELDYEQWLVQNSSSRQMAEKRMSNVRFLLANLLDRIKEDPKTDSDEQLAQALSKLILQDLMERQQQEEEFNQVQLMTLHAAKGLEFPHVFIMGVEEELLPHRNSIGSPAEGSDNADHRQGDSHAIEEERRLFYVGITRAQRSLCLTLAGERRQYGEQIATTPSRFLAEIPADDLEWEGGAQGDPKAKRARGNSALTSLKDLLAAD